MWQGPFTEAAAGVHLALAPAQGPDSKRGGDREGGGSGMGEPQFSRVDCGRHPDIVLNQEKSKEPAIDSSGN